MVLLSVIYHSKLYCSFKVEPHYVLTYSLGNKFTKKGSEWNHWRSKFSESLFQDFQLTTLKCRHLHRWILPAILGLWINTMGCGRRSFFQVPSMTTVHSRWAACWQTWMIWAQFPSVEGDEAYLTWSAEWCVWTPQSETMHVKCESGFAGLSEWVGTLPCNSVITIW